MIETPQSLLDWHGYHVQMRAIMTATTADWVARGVIKGPKKVKVQAQKQMHIPRKNALQRLSSA